MSRFLLALVALASARPGRRAGARAANADLEGAIRDAYVDKHQVHHGSITVDGEAVEFLEAGPKGAAKTVLFCHGAAFSMTTWQHVGVLDALAESGILRLCGNQPVHASMAWSSTRRFLHRYARYCAEPSRLRQLVEDDWRVGRKSGVPSPRRRGYEFAVDADDCCRFHGRIVCVALRYGAGSLPVWKLTSAPGALGDDAAVLARSSGEEPASPRHRAGVASMAWRTTR